MNPMFYFLIAFTVVLAATANAGGKVFDVEGEPVFNSSYYLRPVFDVIDGGLTLSPRGDNECPLYIGQESRRIYPGIPVIFSHWLFHIDYIYESVDLSIKMDVEDTTCAEPTYWSDPAPGAVVEFIVAGSKPLNGSFQIKKSENVIGGYNIVFCPKGTDCSKANKVGIFVDGDSVRRLALSFKRFLRPFEFVLVKVTGTETSSKTMSII